MSIAGLGGGAAAYQQLQRLPNDLGQALEGIAGRQQADKANAQKINEARRIAKQKRDDDFAAATAVDPEKFYVEATNWNDADEIFASVSQKAMDKSIELNAQARKAWDAGNEEEARKYQEDAKRIYNSFKNFASQREEFAAIITDTREKIQTGKILTQAEGQFIDALDRHEYTAEYVDGDFIITALVRDKNGDVVLDENGKPEYIQRSMNDVRKGFHRPFEFEDATGKGGMIDSMMTNFGLKKYDEVNDQYIITSQVWDNSNEIALKNYIEGVTGGQQEVADNREMYKWYMNATGEEKFGDWTEDDKAIVENYIRDGVASQYPEEVSMKIRGLTADEKITEGARDRALRRSEGQADRDARAAEGAANRKARMDELKLRLAANADKDKLKGMGKNAEDKVAAVGLYQLAKQISELGSNADESEVQKIIDNSEYGFVLEGDLDDWFGFGKTEYKIKGAGRSAKQVKDVFGNFKGFVKASGLKLEDTDLKEIMANPSKFSIESTPQETQPTDSDPLGLGL